MLWLPYPDADFSMCMQDCSCWLACLDARCQVLSFSSLSLTPPALQLPSIALDSSMSTPDCSCWLAFLDAWCQVLSFSSPLLAPPASVGNSQSVQAQSDNIQISD